MFSWSIVCVRDVLLPAVQLGRGRQLAEQQQVGDLEVGALLGQLLDRIAAVLEDADVAVDVGDRAPARRGVGEGRVVRHQAEVVVGHLDLPQVHGPDGAVLDGHFVALAGAVVDDGERIGHGGVTRRRSGLAGAPFRRGGPFSGTRRRCRRPRWWSRRPSTRPRSGSPRRPSERGPAACSVCCRKAGMPPRLDVDDSIHRLAAPPSDRARRECYSSDGARRPACRAATPGGRPPGDDAARRAPRP